VPLGTAISLPVDDVLARMSPNTPVEDALLDLYLMLSEAGSPLYLFNELLASWKSTGRRTHIPEGCNSTSSRNSNYPPVPIPVVLENGTEGMPQYSG
jgi:hypothetical protein